MKRLIIALLISGNAAAWQTDFLNEDEDQNKQGYESSQGNRYQYDLSRPADQIKYETDIGAQMRDEMDSIRNPARGIKQEIERDIYNEYGGGIYD